MCHVEYVGVASKPISHIEISPPVGAEWAPAAGAAAAAGGSRGRATFTQLISINSYDNSVRVYSRRWEVLKTGAVLVDAPTRPLIYHADSQSRKWERRNIAVCSAAQVGDKSHP